jgi:hypothetical protein
MSRDELAPLIIHPDTNRLKASSRSHGDMNVTINIGGGDISGG